MGFRYRHGDRPLDGYTIQRGVGSGGFGEVYYAVSDGGRQVALKCLQHNQEIELRGVSQCMNLKSPQLVTIFDVRTGPDGSAYVIMEYVTGPSLRDLLREAPSGMGSEKAAFFFREMARGLGFLHERGVVHRDLKPENIFFEDGFVKIGDYGLSKYISVSRQSCQTISVGTVHYMAPEIGSGRYHRGIDIYALGVILYEMLTGRVPFTGDSFGEILMKHLTVEPDLTGIPEPFLPILKKSLAKNPEERYARAEEMVAELERSPEIQAWIRGFRPEGLSHLGPPLQATETVVLGTPRPDAAGRPGSPSPGGAASPPPIPPQVPPIGAGAGFGARPAREHEPSAPPRQPGSARGFRGQFFSEEAIQRHLFSLATASAVSVALALVTRQTAVPTFLGSLIAIVGGTIAVLVCERDVPGRFIFEPGFPRRVMTLCVASPFYLIQGALAERRGYGPLGLILATALIHWAERTKPTRAERVSFGHAITAGLCGALLGACTQGNPFVVGGILAAVSLAVNCSAPFVPHSARASARFTPPASPAGPFTGRSPAGHGPAAGSPPLPPSPLQAAATAPPAGPRPCGPMTRTFWLGSAALNFATWLSLAIYSFSSRLDREEVAIGLSFAGAAFGYFLFSLCVGMSKSWPGFVTVLRWFLIATFLNGAAASLICLTSFGVNGAEPALFTLIFSLVLAFFLGLLPGRRRTKEDLLRLAAASVPIPNPGWAALGALLVTLAISIVLGSSLLASGVATQVRRDLFAEHQAQFFSFVSSGMHVLTGCAFFLPGLFCVLRSRQGLGALHVLRGAAGFGALAGLVFAASQYLQGAFAMGSDGDLQFTRVRSEDIMGIFCLGVAAAVLLFWPARGLPRAVGGPS